MSALAEARLIDEDARELMAESQRLKRRAARRRAELEAFCRRNGIELKLVRMTRSEEDEVNGDAHRGT